MVGRNIIFPVVSAMALLLGACASGGGEVPAKSVRVSADVVTPVESGKFFVTASAPGESPDMAPYIVKCVEGGLISLGYKPAGSQKDADFTVKCLYSVRRTAVRMECSLEMTRLKEDTGTVQWSGTAVCKANRKYSVRGFIPGLAAGGLSFFNKSIRGATFRPHCNPLMNNACDPAVSPAEESENAR